MFIKIHDTGVTLVYPREVTVRAGNIVGFGNGRIYVDGINDYLTPPSDEYDIIVKWITRSEDVIEVQKVVDEQYSLVIAHKAEREETA